MKLWVLLLLMNIIYASDESLIQEDITKANNVDELTLKMQNAPRRYRYRYIQAIKDRVRLENQTKRQQLMQSLTDDDIATQHINALSGGSSGTGGNSNSSGHGGGRGGGGGHGGGGNR